MRSKKWLVLALCLAVLGFVGCDDDEDIIPDKNPTTIEDEAAFEQQYIQIMSEVIIPSFEALGMLNPFAGGALIVEIAIDELDCLGQSTRSLGLPDLPITTRPDTLDERISGNRISGVW